MRDTPILIRAATPDDLPYIYNTWLRSYGDVLYDDGLKHPASWKPPRAYFIKQTRIIDACLSGPAAVKLVACDNEKPDVIFGYIVAEPSAKTVHWLYVKRVFRKLGIGRQLLIAAGAIPGAFIATHDSPRSLALGRAKGLDITLDSRGATYTKRPR